MEPNTAIVYHVMGNNEIPLHPDMIRDFEMKNYEVRAVNLVTDEIPDDCDILFITMPERDWTPTQAERILNYLQNEGNAIFILGYLETRFPRMDEVLAAYGVRMGDYVVYEGNPNFFFLNTPTALVPRFWPGPITDMFIERDFFPFFAISTGVDLLRERKVSTRYTPLVVTSDQAYGKTDPLGTQTFLREPGDISGPFSLAVAIEDIYFLNRNFVTRIVVIGSEFVLDEGINADMGGTNWAFLSNCMDWLQDKESLIHIPGRRPPSTVPLRMTQGQGNSIAFFSVVILPLIFAVSGLVVWLRRRNA
jgi:ABC-2 type transport system permease protein